MARRDEDLAFVEFQATGQPEHLGRVFDLTAPRLLLVAYHLAPAPADAEDLVQGTFVTALQCAARYDPGQPLFQWLAGILGNHARAARRQAQRPLDPARVRSPVEPAPDDEAAARELAVAIDRALDALPETYRTLVVLRLTHGLKPTEIAHALGRSPEVVRTQLHRGLEQLRAALPQGIALATLAAVVLEGRGLAAVRTAVLAKVPVGVGAAGALGIGGLFMANKMFVATGCVALLLGAAAVWWSSGRTQADAVGVGETQAAPAVAKAASQPVETDRGGSVESRTAMTTGAVASAPDSIAVVGRCVAAESGLPLAGCTVTLDGHRREAEGADRADPQRWQAPPPQMTGADGRFRLVGVLPSTHDLGVLVDHERCVPMSTRRLTRPAGNTLELGDVRLMGGVAVRGMTVDESGTAVDGVSLRTTTEATSSTPRFELNNPHAVSRDGGRFDLGILPIGRHRLESEHRHVLVAPLQLDLTAATGAVDLRVVVRAAPTLSGVVVDASSTPVSGIQLEAESLGSPGIAGSSGRREVVTDARGEFIVYGRGEGGPVRLSFRTSTYLPLVPLVMEPGPGPFPWGTTGIRVVVPRPAADGAARIRVVDALNQQPVEEFGYQCQVNQTQPRGAFGDSAIRRSKPARHAEGIVDLTSLRVGDHFVMIYPRGQEWPAAGPVFFEVTPGVRAEVVVPIRPATEFRVQVVRRDGAPVAGGEVELLHPLGKTPTFQSRSLRLEDPVGPCCPDDLVILRAKATTQADGIATFQAPGGQGGITLRVLPVECGGQVVSDVTVPEAQSDPLRVVVADHATLVGTITPPGLVARLARSAYQQAAGLTLLPDSGDARQRLPDSRGFFAVDAAGRFRITGVPPGSWRVMLSWNSPMAGGASSPHCFVPQLATITVADGQKLHLDLEARMFEPATVRGRILLDGAPLPNQAWFLGGLSGPNRIAVGGQPTDADGWFECDVVIPGTYCLFSWTHSRTGPSQALQADSVLSVTAGERIERTFTIPAPVALSVQLAGADGTTPLAGRELSFQSQFGNRLFTGSATTDAQGNATLEPAIPFPIEVTMRDPETSGHEFHKLDPAEQARRTVRLGTVEREPGNPRMRVRFTLPAR